MDQKIKIEPDAIKAIADEVKNSLNLKDVAKEAIGEYEAAQAEKTEKTVKKNVTGDNPNVNIKSGIENEPKEVRLLKSVIALNSGNYEALKRYNGVALELRRKAGYANSGTDADGGYVVLEPEFEAEIEKLSPAYGVALTDADVRRISSDSVKTNKRGSNVSMYEVTTEGGQKQGTKMTISQATVTLREFAAIAIATNRLVEDAAIDFWAEVSQGFAEEYARWADRLVFTDNHAEYPGIIYTDGVGTESVGAAITDLDWDDLLDAEAEIPSAARANMKHYMHRSVWNILTKVKASVDGRYQFTPNPNGQLATPWGTPVVLSDSLPSSSVVGDGNEGFIVTGDLKRAKLYIKRGLVLERSNEATVHDADGNAVNLFERNMQALKAEIRMAALIKFPEAFNVIGTGTVS